MFQADISTQHSGHLTYKVWEPSECFEGTKLKVHILNSRGKFMGFREVKVMVYPGNMLLFLQHRAYMTYFKLSLQYIILFGNRIHIILVTCLRPQYM